MTTLSCYLTYFVSPTTDTLSHQLLLGSDAGAALLNGAATLSGFTFNEALAGRALSGVFEGRSIGESIQAAQDALGTSYRSNTANWVLLGDPSLIVHP